MGSADNVVPVLVSRTGLLADAMSIFCNKGFVAGVVLGVAALGGGYAISASSGGGGVAYSDPNSTLLSDQESVITAQMRADAQACASGTQQGTVGNAINMSLKAHLELASASPNVEQLFDVNADCFAGLSALLDLSFAIPSLATILAAAQQAVIAYAKKKICSAVSKVTGMVTGPINQAIGQANQYIGALNGLSANLNSSGGMSLLDPNLGANYNIGQTGTYNTGQPFGNQPQATVPDSTGGTGTTPGTGTNPGTGTGTGTGTNPTPGTGGTNGPGSYFAVYSDLMRQLSTAEGQLTTANQNLAAAQQAANVCVADCTAQAQAVASAQTAVNNVQTVISGIRCRLDNLQADGTVRANACVGSGSGTTLSGRSVQSSQSLTQKLTNLFQ